MQAMSRQDVETDRRVQGIADYFLGSRRPSLGQNRHVKNCELNCWTFIQSSMHNPLSTL